jgi:hypothetical protein
VGKRAVSDVYISAHEIMFPPHTLTLNRIRILFVNNYRHRQSGNEMKILATGQSREEYVSTQIERSRDKFEYCKVSIGDVMRWRKILRSFGEDLIGPIVCFGTRNGREIDLFRLGFFSNPIRIFLTKMFEVRKKGFSSLVLFVERFNQSSIDKLTKNSVIGVEINPQAKRKDALIASFDELPEEFENRFSIAYSNSFDQSEDPIKTSQEWIRVMKKSGILIIGFGPQEPTISDPVGNLTIEDFQKLFGGEVLYFSKKGGRYYDLIIKIIK